MFMGIVLLTHSNTFAQFEELNQSIDDLQTPIIELIQNILNVVLVVAFLSVGTWSVFNLSQFRQYIWPLVGIIIAIFFVNIADDIYANFTTAAGG